jgi:DNA-binding MarR family transcriptional regulator
MKSRKKIIEEVMADFQFLRNKMKTKVLQSGQNSLVTYSQWFILAIIEQNRDIGITEIAKLIGISPSATTQLVDGLVDNKYVERKADLKDRRALCLKLSDKGKKYIIGRKEEHMGKMVKLFDVLSNKELATYLKLNKKILTNVSEEIIL